MSRSAFSALTAEAQILVATALVGAPIGAHFILAAYVLFRAYEIPDEVPHRVRPEAVPAPHPPHAALSTPA